ncbi:hypothetical protein HDV05_002710, partial [Chytridiales sp. JEL 0842]
MMINSAFLIVYYRGHVSLKHQYTTHVLKRTKLTKIEYRSLIMYGIPQEIRHEVDLAAYLEGMGLGSVENVVICRKWNKLRNAVKMRFWCLQQLERIYHEVKSGRGRLYRGPRTVSPGSNQNGQSRSRTSADFGAEGELLQFTSNDDDEEQGNGSHALNGVGLNAATTPLLSNNNNSRHRRFSISDAHNDPSLFEIMNYLDAVDPRLRPAHRTGLWGLGGDLVDSADYYAAKYKEWDTQ